MGQRTAHLTVRSCGRWLSALPNPAFNWNDARAAYNQARNNGQPFKWHTFFWGNQQPAWMETLPTEKQVEAIHIWLAAIAAEFPDLEQIEVVNEPLHDPPRGLTNGNYIQALGGTNSTNPADENWVWVVNAFKLARQYFPNAKLVLNDYGITNDGNATTRYLTIINLLQAEGLIDHIGVQGHAFEFNYNNLAWLRCDAHGEPGAAGGDGTAHLRHRVRHRRRRSDLQRAG